MIGRGDAEERGDGQSQRRKRKSCGIISRQRPEGLWGSEQ